MTQLTVTLSLPPPELSPNWTVGSRGGRLGKATKIKAYRCTAKMAAVAAMGRTDPPMWKSATVLATFYVRDRRRRDRDNLLGSLKAGLDGLADAGLVNDDAGLTHQPVRVFVDRANPRVELQVWETVPVREEANG